MNKTSDQPAKKENSWWERIWDKNSKFKILAPFFIGAFTFIAIRYIDVWAGIQRPGVTHLICFACLIAFTIVFNLLKISSRSEHRFSLRSLFYFMTIVSLYAMMLGSISKIEIDFLDWFPAWLAFVIFYFSVRLIGNQLLFVESWGNRWEDGNDLVASRWQWPVHLGVAVFVLGLWSLSYCFSDQAKSFYFPFCCTIALFSHAHAVTRTSITSFDEGIRFVGKAWRWKDGPLKLFEHQGTTRLGPHWVDGQSSWRKHLWPIVPEENLEDVRKVLVQKLEAAENLEGYYS